MRGIYPRDQPGDIEDVEIWNDPAGWVSMPTRLLQPGDIWQDPTEKPSVMMLTESVAIRLEELRKDMRTG